MDAKPNTTIVTAGDANYAWGAFLLVASMRMNGMTQPVIVGAMNWPEEMKKRLIALGGVAIQELAQDKRCVACQKPMLMALDRIETPWVCWADSDAIFIGDCTEWLTGDSEEEITIRRYDPPPPDFTDANKEIWKRDVAALCGNAREQSRYPTRFNSAFIVIHRKWCDFLKLWQKQIETVLPSDVEIIMAKMSAYFQTDESVLGSLLCYDPGAPAVAAVYKANGSIDRSRYFAHFAYNPKPWQMWNSYSLRWYDAVLEVVKWSVEHGFVKASELPGALRPGLRPLYKLIAPLAPWVWRAIKLKRRLFR